MPKGIACKYGDPFCPCQDGMLCHYEGPNPMTPPEPTGFDDLSQPAALEYVDSALSELLGE